MAKTLETRLKILTTAQLATVYNEVSERKVSRFSDHSTALKRTVAAVQAAGKDVTVQSAGDPFQYQLTDAGSAAQSREGDDRTITVVVESNPKAKGSKSAKRFGLYKNGMTVGEYVAAASKLGGGRRKAVRDITWDSAHGFIKLA